jgi:hypothetical protein
MTNDDNWESTEATDIQSFLNQNKSPGNVTSYSNQQQTNDDMDDVFKAREEKLKLAQQRKRDGEAMVGQWVKNARESAHLCQWCKRYFYLESLPNLRPIVDSAITFKYPQYHGQSKYHLRAHIGYHHPELIDACLQLQSRNVKLNNIIRHHDDVADSLRIENDNSARRRELENTLAEIDSEVDKIITEDKELIKARRINSELEKKELEDYNRSIGAVVSH